jgi:hypothetical protein
MAMIMKIGGVPIIIIKIAVVLSAHDLCTRVLERPFQCGMAITKVVEAERIQELPAREYGLIGWT